MIGLMVPSVSASSHSIETPDHIIGKKDAKFMWAKDEKVNKTLEESGYIVLRFYASDIEKNPKKHLQKILKTIKKS